MNDNERGFSRRERQIMDIVYRLEKATARQIHESMEEAPSYTSVRTHLRAMLEKGYLQYKQDGVRYLYEPIVPRTEAKTSALKNVLQNFFSGSQQDLVATLIDSESANMSNEQLEQLESMIANAKKEGR